jgi:nucleoside recognition membrane protein YjiH
MKPIERTETQKNRAICVNGISHIKDLVNILNAQKQALERQLKQIDEENENGK